MHMAGAFRLRSNLNDAWVIGCDARSCRNKIRMPLGIVGFVVVITENTQYAGRRRILQIQQVDQSAIVEAFQRQRSKLETSTEITTSRIRINIRGSDGEGGLLKE